MRFNEDTRRRASKRPDGRSFRQSCSKSFACLSILWAPFHLALSLPGSSFSMSAEKRLDTMDESQHHHHPVKERPRSSAFTCHHLFYSKGIIFLYDFLFQGLANTMRPVSGI